MFSLYKGLQLNESPELINQLDKLKKKEDVLTELLGKHLAEMIKVYAREQYEIHANLRREYDSYQDYLKYEGDILIDDFLHKAKDRIHFHIKKHLKDQK